MNWCIYCGGKVEWSEYPKIVMAVKVLVDNKEEESSWFFCSIICVQKTFCNRKV